MLNWIKRNFQKPDQQELPLMQSSVTFDEKSVELRIPDGRKFSIAWHELIKVTLETTDDGPFSPDVFWILETPSASLRIPQGVQGERELLHRLQQLPDFKNEAVISAMGSTDNNMFVCWARRSG